MDQQKNEAMAPDAVDKMNEFLGEGEETEQTATANASDSVFPAPDAVQKAKACLKAIGFDAADAQAVKLLRMFKKKGLMV